MKNFLKKLRRSIKKFRRSIFGLESKNLWPLVFETERNCYTFTVSNETYVKILDEEITGIIMMANITSDRRLIFRTFCDHAFIKSTSHKVERKIERIYNISFMRFINGGISLSFHPDWKLDGASDCRIFGFSRHFSLMGYLQHHEFSSFKGSIVLFRKVNKYNEQKV